MGWVCWAILCTGFRYLGQNTGSLAVFLMTCQGVDVLFYGDPFLSMVAGDGSWKLDLFRPWVLEKIINKIISIPPPHPLSGPNRIIWGATSTGSFSLKSSYEKDLSSFYSGSLLDWMKNNLQSHSSSWVILIGQVSLGLSWTRQYSSISVTSSHKARSRLHNWPLHNDWVSLNTDGSVKFDEGFAADSGCVRDHNGEWIIAFAKYLSNCTILEAEL
ncbi:hypothetical protein PVK06_016611 [Gossypium arboreum]|uniref:Uncharacterized protein n=1 Tax=Gossypium arboreum TaxID=29729 RepID=A0ABR0Q1K9_GOSAR|nr:hypothetical protein PVK06_016611 [Gossypium arboreum]